MTAAEKILQKALVASKIDSSQWNSIQAGLRDRAFFSSQVAQANILQGLRQMAADRANGVSASDAREAMREALKRLGHETPQELQGTIKDLYSKSRLDVIIKTNVAQARGFIDWMEANSPGAYAAFPAQEFLRVKAVKNPRGDWPKRWQKAGGKIFPGGRMIALKDDPVWVKLSVFGNPFPPFDWGSGMGLEDIGRKEAIKLGLIDDKKLSKRVAEKRNAKPVGFNGNLQAELPMKDDSPEAAKLKDIFGDLVKFDGNTAHWQGELIKDSIRGKIKKTSLGIGFDGRKTSISSNFFREHLNKHFGDNEKAGELLPLNEGDYELLPSIWRNPDRVIKSGKRDILELEAFDGGILRLVVDPDSGIRSFHKLKAARSTGVGS